MEHFTTSPGIMIKKKKRHTEREELTGNGPQDEAQAIGLQDFV